MQKIRIQVLLSPENYTNLEAYRDTNGLQNPSKAIGEILTKFWTIEDRFSESIGRVSESFRKEMRKLEDKNKSLLDRIKEKNDEIKELHKQIVKS